MYTNCYSFIEYEYDEYSSFMEDFDRFLLSLDGTVKHVTHVITDVREGKKHYFTFFLEPAAKPADA